MTLGAEGSAGTITGAGAGKAAVEGNTCFAATAVLDPITGAGLQELPDSCGACGLCDGRSVCLWHGGSLETAACAAESSDSAIQEPPHCKCRIKTVIRKEQIVFIGSLSADSISATRAF